MWRRSTRGQPRIVYHRPRWPRRRGLGDWLRLGGGVALLLVLGGYMLWLFVGADAADAGGSVVYLPLVLR